MGKGKENRSTFECWGPLDIWWRAYVQMRGEFPEEPELQRWYQQESRLAFTSDDLPAYAQVLDRARSLCEAACADRIFLQGRYDGGCQSEAVGGEANVQEADEADLTAMVSLSAATATATAEPFATNAQPKPPASAPLQSLLLFGLPAAADGVDAAATAAAAARPAAVAPSLSSPAAVACPLDVEFNPLSLSSPTSLRPAKRARVRVEVPDPAGDTAAAAVQLPHGDPADAGDCATAAADVAAPAAAAAGAWGSIQPTAAAATAAARGAATPGGGAVATAGASGWVATASASGVFVRSPCSSAGGAAACTPQSCPAAPGEVSEVPPRDWATTMTPTTATDAATPGAGTTAQVVMMGGSMALSYSGSACGCGCLTSSAAGTGAGADAAAGEVPNTILAGAPPGHPAAVPPPPEPLTSLPADSLSNTSRPHTSFSTSMLTTAVQLPPPYAHNYQPHHPSPPCGPPPVTTGLRPRPASRASSAPLHGYSVLSGATAAASPSATVTGALSCAVPLAAAARGPPAGALAAGAPAPFSPFVAATAAAPAVASRRAAPAAKTSRLGLREAANATSAASSSAAVVQQPLQLRRKRRTPTPAGPLSTQQEQEEQQQQHRHMCGIHSPSSPHEEPNLQQAWVAASALASTFASAPAAAPWSPLDNSSTESALGVSTWPAPSHPASAASGFRTHSRRQVPSAAAADASDFSPHQQPQLGQGGGEKAQSMGGNSSSSSGGAAAAEAPHALQSTIVLPTPSNTLSTQQQEPQPQQQLGSSQRRLSLTHAALEQQQQQHPPHRHHPRLALPPGWYAYPYPYPYPLYYPYAPHQRPHLPLSLGRQSANVAADGDDVTAPTQQGPHGLPYVLPYPVRPRLRRTVSPPPPHYHYLLTRTQRPMQQPALASDYASELPPLPPPMAVGNGEGDGVDGCCSNNEAHKLQESVLGGTVAQVMQLPLNNNQLTASVRQQLQQQHLQQPQQPTEQHGLTWQPSLHHLQVATPLGLDSPMPPSAPSLLQPRQAQGCRTSYGCEDSVVHLYGNGSSAAAGPMHAATQQAAGGVQHQPLTTLAASTFSLGAEAGRPVLAAGIGEAAAWPAGLDLGAGVAAGSSWRASLEEAMPLRASRSVFYGGGEGGSGGGDANGSGSGIIESLWALCAEMDGSSSAAK
ncbi:hypothetical protein Agub_g8735 [Astrephomene gubernaculifera]|uniref:Uncharacterized protein n=1 Tax=Astrephomene gubernaculifera TaxID=47775 RepID=A0AAD3DS45_9CHLO|nr:hypothetical protein Agub_g8735 [Astrephomene gubernaculifera]